MSENKIEKKRKKSLADEEISRKKKKSKKSSKIKKSDNAELMTQEDSVKKWTEPGNLDDINEEQDSLTSQNDELEMIGNDAVREMKKLKKEKMSKKKEEKKKLKENVVGESIDPVQKCIEDSLAYLHNWKNNRSEWKFQKKRQTWLLKHMYDTKTVSDDDFNVLLEYMTPLQGLSRTLTLQQAEGYATVHDSNASDSEESEDESQEEKSKEKKGWMSATQLDRVRQVIQLLS